MDGHRKRILLLNYNTFSSSHLSTRRGSEKDVEALGRLFRGLGFVVRLQEDPTSEDTYTFLYEFITEAVMHSSDMIVIGIMSHGGTCGTSDTFFSSDSQINYLGDIIK